MFMILVACNVAVAVTGFAKDLTTAAYLGTTVAADAFANAYFVVDTIALNILAVAVWIGSASTFGVSRQECSDLTYRATVRMGILYSSLGAILLSGALLGLRHPFIRLLAESAVASHLMDRIYLALIPMAIAYPIYMVIAGALQATGAFVTSTLAPSLLNSGVVCSALWCVLFHVSRGSGVVILGFAYSFGSIMMLALLLVGWIRFENSQSVQLRWKDVRRLRSHATLRNGYRTTAAYATYLTLQQLVGFVERYMAARMGEGSVAALTYAYRISQLPNWVVVSAMMVIVLPKVAPALKRHDRAESTSLVGKAVRLVLLICLPTAILLALWARPIVELLLERGAFGPNSVRVTAEFLSTYALAIVTQAMATVLFRTVSSTGKIRWSILSSVIATLMNISFDILIFPKLGAWTFGLGSCLWGLTACVTLLIYLYKQRLVDALLTKRDIIVVFTGNLLLAFLCVLVSRIWFAHLEQASSVERTTALMVATAGVVIIYVGLLSASVRWLKSGGR